MRDAAAGRLAEIERSCSRIRSYLAGMDKSGFQADLRTQDAVLMQLIVIGEAANALSGSVLAEAPEIEWSAITALRNRIAHGYDTINRTQIWELCEEHLTHLETAIARMLAARGELPP